MPQFETRTDSPGETPEEPQIHVSTGQESSGSGSDSTQGLRNQHRRERNPERPPSNSHGDWPFLRPPERVPEVPVVSREHLPQLEKIQEVLPSRREGKRDTAATAREEIARACPHSRRGLTPLGRLQKNPKSMSSLERNPQVPAATPHKVLGPGIDGRGIPSGPRSTRMGTDLS